MCVFVICCFPLSTYLKQETQLINPFLNYFLGFSFRFFSFRQKPVRDALSGRLLVDVSCLGYDFSFAWYKYSNDRALQHLYKYNKYSCTSRKSALEILLLCSTFYHNLYLCHGIRGDLLHHPEKSYNLIGWPHDSLETVVITSLQIRRFSGQLVL